MDPKTELASSPTALRFLSQLEKAVWHPDPYVSGRAATFAKGLWFVQGIENPKLRRAAYRNILAGFAVTVLCEMHHRMQ